jgi:hypothetical protein
MNTSSKMPESLPFIFQVETAQPPNPDATGIELGMIVLPPETSVLTVPFSRSVNRELSDSKNCAGISLAPSITGQSTLSYALVNPQKENTDEPFTAILF